MLSGRGSRLYAVAFLGMASLASFIVVSTAVVGIVPAGVPVVWFVGLAAIVSGAVARRRSAASPRIAHASVAAFALYLIGLFVFGQSARTLALEEHRLTVPDSPAQIVSVNPRPGIPWDFQITVWNKQRVYRYLAVAFGGRPRALPSIETGLDDPALEAIRGTRAFRGWKSFVRQPIVRREGRYLVLGDARYRVGRRGDWTEIRVPVPGGE